MATEGTLGPPGVSTVAPHCSQACSHPELLAVVSDEPSTFSAAASEGPFGGYPCELTPLHLAAALGRAKCAQVLLDAGACPFLWTRPPTAGSRQGWGPAPTDEEGFTNYEGVCASAVYQTLKQHLPNSSSFPYTFTLAQLLLRTPCSPLLLAVRFGQAATARKLLVAMQRVNGVSLQRAAVRGRDPSPAAGRTAANTATAAADAAASDDSSGSDSDSGSGSDSDSGGEQEQAASLRSFRQHLGAALAYWPVASEPQWDLLRRLLLVADGGQPLRHLLPSTLARYANCNPSSGMADKLRAGLREVLAHVLPAAAASRGGQQRRGGSAAAATAAAAAGGWRGGMPPPPAPAQRLLLTAAVVCRDEARCQRLLASLAGCESSPWRDVAANCALLAACASHDMAGVVGRLLALPPAPGQGLPPFTPDMWGPNGLSVLMAAAHRGALGTLRALLAAGAAVNLADEMGATALHWAVVGCSQEAVMLLAQHGAAVAQAGVVHEEEEHLEMPLLTAAARGNLPMIRLLVGLGAHPDTAAPSGSSALSVAVCWEQQAAAALLLDLGADPNRVLPPHINGGCYPMWSDSYAAEESYTLLGMACSRIDIKVYVAMLLRAGADPSLRHPKTGLTPAAEAASIGALEEAALLIQMAAQSAGHRTLEQLGWADAVAQAAEHFHWHRCACPGEALEPLLELWHRQPEPMPAAPPLAACLSIVTALLANPTLKPEENAARLQAGAELSAVLQAERLATVGVCADLTDRLAGSCCRSVVLAAAPAATRWSLATHRYFPPAFKRAVRLLLLLNHRLAAQVRHLDEGGRSSNNGSSGSGTRNRGGSGRSGGSSSRVAGSAGTVRAPPRLRRVQGVQDLRGAAQQAGHSGLSPWSHPLLPLSASEDTEPPLAEEAEAQAEAEAGGSAGGGESGGGGGGGGSTRRRLPKVASTADVSDRSGCGAAEGAEAGCITTSGWADGAAPAGDCGGDSGASSPCALLLKQSADFLHTISSSRGGSIGPQGSGSGSGIAAGASAAAVALHAALSRAVQERAPCAVVPLPRDALLEVARHLGAMPLSFWLSQPSNPPATGGRPVGQAPPSVV